MRLVLGLAAAFLTVAPPAFAASEDCLAYEAGDGGSPVVQASVQGRGPFAFVLDTASSGTTLDAATVADLGLPRDVATETAQGMGGPMDVRLFRVADLAAGPLRLTDFTAPEIPAPAFDSHPVVGLAGIDLFGDALAVWNAAPGCVIILRSGEQPKGESWRRVAVQWIRPWKIMLPIRINGVDGWGLLDTGAQHTVLNPVFAARLTLTDLSDGGEITGLDGRPLPLSQTQVSDIEIGRWLWSRRTLRIGDLPVFARLGDPAAPLAVIGIDWLAGQGFAVDYGAEAVWQQTPEDPVSVDNANH
jgi:hypothetical protein